MATGLIVAESCVPSGASGKQSNFLSMILSAFINDTMPTREVEKIGPTSIDISGDERFVGADKAVVGTTKMFTYDLTFAGESKNVVLDGGMRLTPVQTPGQGSYTYSLTPISAKKGALRFIPLEEGHYEFSLSDNYGLSKTVSFEAVDRLSPKDVVAVSNPSAALKINEYSSINYYLASEIVTDKYADHYLHRWFDPSLLNWSSSNDAVFTVDEYGFMKGVSQGEANLLCDGKVIQTVTVSNEVIPVSAFTDFELTSSTTSVHPLDYDYYGDEENYGVQLQAAFNDGNSHPVYWISDNPLVALVSNSHVEKVGEEFRNVTPGFVAGYRKTGTVNITAIAVENPAVRKTIQLTCENVSPSSFDVAASQSGKAIDLTQVTSFQAGSSVLLTGSFSPKNSSNQILHVATSDASVAAIANNDTSSPTINFLKEGEVDISITCPASSNNRVFGYHFSVTPLPRISEDEMPEFRVLVRKGIGHFSLFAFDGILFALAFGLTFFRQKVWGSAVTFGASLPVGFAIGGISELIQAIPALKRGASMVDVMIDFFGFAAGALVVAAILLVIGLIVLLRKPRTTA